MLKHLLAASVFLIAAIAHAQGYGNYDPKRMLTVSETQAGKKYGFDLAYLDNMLNDLSLHAKNYPSRFDTPQDRQRATQDVKVLSGMLDILINVPTPNPELLMRAGYLNSLGHNLEIAGAAEKANTIFQRLLTIVPSHPRGNYMYGAFLAGVGKFRQALPYLELARAAGVVDASYAIGMTYLAIGDKNKALENLEAYKRLKPNDSSVHTLIDAIRNGKIEHKGGK